MGRSTPGKSSRASWAFSGKRPPWPSSKHWTCRWHRKSTLEFPPRKSTSWWETAKWCQVRRGHRTDRANRGFPFSFFFFSTDTEKIYEKILRDLIKSYNSTYPWATRMKVMGTTEQRTVSIIVNDLKLSCTVDEFLKKFREKQLVDLAGAPLMRGTLI